MNDSEQNKRFERWITDHGAILHHVVNGFAEGDDRNDLMQELLLALWKAAPAFRGNSRPSTFIYRVAHNAALTWKRTRHNYLLKLDRYESMAAWDSSNNNIDPSARQLEQVYAAIRRLPPLDRSLMLLSLDAVSYRDMASIHGLTESNVGVRLNRARNKPIQQLKGTEHES